VVALNRHGEKPTRTQDKTGGRRMAGTVDELAASRLSARKSALSRARLLPAAAGRPVGLYDDYNSAG